MTEITIDDFTKCELCIATVKAVEDVPGSDKLLKLQIDVGDSERQIVAGIKTGYTPEDLVGKQIVVLLNIKPREYPRFGVRSDGMLLAADADHPVLLVPDNEVPAGTKIR